MQNQSVLPFIPTPRHPQSVAALLPEEIVDLIFAQFGFDHSMDASREDRVERHMNLSNMTVIAEGWTRPARRLLVRLVKVQSWAHLQDTVPAWAGELVRGLSIGLWGSEDRNPPAAANAVFKLLKQLPNLRRLRLISLSLDFFDPTDSASMQSGVLPHLDDLSIYDLPSPHSIIFDLLATSNHKISRLSVYPPHQSATPRVTSQKLDFRGNLRFLSTGGDFYRTLVDSRWTAHDGLVGLTELRLRGIDDRSRRGGEELYRVIAPTLSKLSIDSSDFAWFARPLPLLSKLIRLSISGLYSGAEPDPTPLLLCLPPSLSFLQLISDRKLHPSLVRWTATPSLVPAGLKQIEIDYIYQIETYQQLPPIQTLGTNYRSNTLDSLGRLSPGTRPFRTLEMFFHDDHLGRRSLVEAECARLGVTSRPGVKPRNDFYG